MTDLDNRPYNCTLEEEVQRAWYMNKKHAHDASEASRRNSIYAGILIRVLSVLDHDASCKDFHDTNPTEVDDLVDECSEVVQFFGGDIRDAYDVRLALALARYVAALCRKIEARVKELEAVQTADYIEATIEACRAESRITSCSEWGFNYRHIEERAQDIASERAERMATPEIHNPRWRTFSSTETER